jgi:uncharacterized membrane protein
VKGLGTLVGVSYPFLIYGLGTTGVLGERKLVLFVPILINAALLGAFARTLRRGPSMVERFARLGGERLGAEGIAYCRKVTIVWCVFFVLNGGVILWLALFGSLAQWTLYTGFVAYLLVGALLGLEVVYRAWRFGSDASAVGRVVRRLWPPARSG